MGQERENSWLCFLPSGCHRWGSGGCCSGTGLHRRSHGLHGQRRGGVTEWPHSQPCLGHCLPATGEGRHRSGRKGTCRGEEEMAKQVLEGGWGRDAGQTLQICQGFPHLCLGDPVCLPQSCLERPLPNGRQLASTALPQAPEPFAGGCAAHVPGGGGEMLHPCQPSLQPGGPWRVQQGCHAQWLWGNCSAFWEGVSEGRTTSRLFPKGTCPPEAPSSLVPLLLQTHPAGSCCPTLRGGRADPHPPGHPALLPVHWPLAGGTASPGLLGESGVPCTNRPLW